MISSEVHIGNVTIGGGRPIAVQTMCNTHTSDIEGTVAQCVDMARCGAHIIRITVPTPSDVENIRIIRERLRERGVDVPIVADIHFSSSLAIAVAPFVDKVRINPGNFHPSHDKARAQFRQLLGVCARHGTAIRIGLNHGSLGQYITDLYGNTPEAMALAAMEWIGICREENFHEVVVSLKSSNTRVMVDAYRALVRMMEENGFRYPLHVGVTEAGNSDSGRIKSCVGIGALLEEGIGDTLRVSLTEDPLAEIPVGQYLADRYSRHEELSGEVETNDAFLLDGEPSDGPAEADPAEAEERLMLDAACTWGPALLDHRIDSIPDVAGLSRYMKDEIMQAARRRFYKPEYIACPGCGRTMYDLQKAFEEVKSRTAHLSGMVIAVMGCIVNGPGEMADADWGYVGEGGGKVSIYRGRTPVLRHIPESEAVDKLLELIEQQNV